MVETFTLSSYPQLNDSSVGRIHVLVVIPEGARSAKKSEWSAVELSTVDPHLKQDITKLTEWSVGELYGLPSISEFMKDLGGCTQGGKLYWRLEEKQIVSIILKGWSGDEFPVTIKNMKCILMGSPGVGKSTMLCMLVFYAVFKQKKNVILYRKLMKAGQSNCLVYLGYVNDQVKYFALPQCEVSKRKKSTKRCNSNKRCG
ncbi:Aste57867_4301 [Aphanomyces stellatus]|uniref:Aste57867_4301 protein n=1 Tax=Aphanomyces stellatus TaxID=120398 RepID=A0A485KB78_9STRA|nr:hypothetical protein As57867_004290 [Aphanomyces stellatus]VFT81416.1 Aste57867_4301 [Aphanomyces stellatus]